LRHGILLVAKLSQTLLGIGDGFVATLRTFLFIDGFPPAENPIRKGDVSTDFGAVLMFRFPEALLGRFTERAQLESLARVCQGCAPI